MVSFTFHFKLLEVFSLDFRRKLVGFEAPGSPDSAYKNAYPLNEDEELDLPLVPPQLLHTLLSHPARGNAIANLPLPQNVIHHFCVENREPPQSVVAMGITHRFRSKFVTVVLYRSVQRRGSACS